MPARSIFTTVDAPGVDSEELRAKELSDSQFVVDSIPFVDNGLALGDIVYCVAVNGQMFVDSVVVRGGNSTLRILPHGVDVVSPLLSLGCRVEEGPAGVLAVSYGPDAPGEGLNEWLETLAADGLIDLAPGYVAGSCPT